MLIIENIGLSVTSRPKVYDNVMLTWTNSLRTMEHLVSGVAQRVQIPEALLGLSSWHVYPDMIVLSKDTISIQQNDKLIQKGGVVTLGMRSSNTENDVGIMWTMSLAHLRSYGKPIQSAKSVGPGSSRVPFFRIVQVALGSAISQWGNNNADFHKVCNLLISLDKRRDRDLQCFGGVESQLKEFENRALEQTPPDSGEQSEWCKLFADQARSFQSAKEAEKQEFLRYVGLGKRLGVKFLAESHKHPEPVFGLSSIADLLSLLDINGQIEVLRHISATYQTQFDAKHSLIVYNPISDQKDCLSVEYATLLPYQYGDSDLGGHRRWLGPTSRPASHPRDGYGGVHAAESRSHNTISPQKLFSTRKRGRDHETLEDLMNYEPSIKRSIFLMETTSEPCGLLGYQEISWEREPFFHPLTKLEEPQPLFGWYASKNRPNFNILKKFAEDHTGKLGVKELTHGWQMGATPHQFFGGHYERILGSDSVAVYQSTYIENKSYAKGPLERRPIDWLPIDYIQGILDSELPCNLAVLKHFWRAGSSTSGYAAYFNSLAALSRASTLYSTLPEADVQLEVVRKCLSEAKWVQSVDGTSWSSNQYITIPRVKRSIAFACISLFDTGNVDLSPADFDDVLGLSSPGTLYVSEVLLNDPGRPDDSKIRCLIGNIGRPGLALLRTPLDPMFREAELEFWHLVNRNEFDGHLENNFRATSLQLTLTGSETPIDISRQAFRDSEVFYAEARISAHDHGDWIGDINVLNVNALGINHDHTLSEWLLPRTMPDLCSHDENQRQDFKSFGPVVSIDSWWEYLDAPSQRLSIVRAKGNYIARLAIAAAQRQRRGLTILTRGIMCWACVSQLASVMELDTERTIVIC